MMPFLAHENNKDVINIVQEELYAFKKVLHYLQESSVKSALHLFLKRISSRSIDDVRGGKITVMGLLETRMVSFEGVVIVDFNEGFVPRRSEKDLYLNSKVRQRSKLPTLNDRESLQKLYYYNLMRRAKSVSISYVEDTQHIPSRFLKELGIATSTWRDDESYSNVLFEKHTPRLHVNLAIEAQYDFKSEALSASKLKTFLTCKRAFYHQYIQKLRPHKIEKDLPDEHEIGVIIHEVLKEVYLRQNRYEDADALKRDITHHFEKKISDNVLHEYQLRLWLRHLEPFIANEIGRFKQGYEVAYCEKHFQKSYRNLMLQGVVDRVDRNGDMTEILDYKSGSLTLYSKSAIEKATDFQLEFYYLLVDGSSKSVAFYDLKECRIVEEEFLELKLEKLNMIFDELAATEYFSFDMTDDRSACRFCHYVHLCQRG
jgi:RecB family exonuclease